MSEADEPSADRMKTAARPPRGRGRFDSNDHAMAKPVRADTDERRPMT